MTVLDSGLIIRDHLGNTLDVMIEAFGGVGSLRLPVDIARVMGAKAEVSGGYIIVTLDLIEEEDV
jgi:hypothetical protein